MPSKTHPRVSVAGSPRDNWATPPEICALLERFAVGPVSLDPCAAMHSPLRAFVKYYGPGALDATPLFPDEPRPSNDRDGLQESWGGVRIVYVNPPYSDPEPWVRKCVVESARCDAIIAMLRCDPSVAWWECVWMAHALCFPRRRVQFVPPPGIEPSQNTGPNVLALWLPPGAGSSSEARRIEARRQRFCEIFREIGRVLLLPGGAW